MWELISHMCAMGNKELSAASRIRAKTEESTESTPEAKGQTGQKNQSKGKYVIIISFTPETLLFFL